MQEESGVMAERRRGPGADVKNNGWNALLSNRSEKRSEPVRRGPYPRRPAFFLRGHDGVAGG